jgi:hypothetical protein
MARIGKRRFDNYATQRNAALTTVATNIIGC